MRATDNNKKGLRGEIIKKRDSIPKEVRESKDRKILDNLISMQDYRKAKSIMLFASFRSEVNTYPVIEDAIRKNKKVVLPRVDIGKKELKLYSIAAIDELRPGFMDIPEPVDKKSKEVKLDDLDFILMPGVAFDEKGGRLGYGGGYYDRLAGKTGRKAHLIGIAYDEQIVDEVPVSARDVRVEAIVTDKQIIKVN